MKLAVSMWSYVANYRAGGFSIGDFVRAAHAAGAEGVELLDVFYRDPADFWGDAVTPEKREHGRASAREALEATGLPVPIFSVGNNFAKAAAGERAEQVRVILDGIAEARHYGASVVRVFAGDVAEGITFDAVRGYIVDGLAEASVAAHEAGIALALENHGSLAGRADQVRGLIEDVRAKARNGALGANPDTGNFLLQNQTPHEAVASLADLARMVHFKDFARATPGEKASYTDASGVPFVGRAVGEGEVDLGACVAGLREGGFDGWLSIEYEGAEDALTAIPALGGEREGLPARLVVALCATSKASPDPGGDGGSKASAAAR